MREPGQEYLYISMPWIYWYDASECCVQAHTLPTMVTQGLASLQVFLGLVSALMTINIYLAFVQGPSVTTQVMVGVGDIASLLRR